MTCKVPFQPKLFYDFMKVWSKEDLHLIEEDQIREHLNKLNIHMIHAA